MISGKIKKKLKSVIFAKIVLGLSVIVSLILISSMALYVFTTDLNIVEVSPETKEIKSIALSSDSKSILSAETKEVIFTIDDANKYLKESDYAYDPDTFQNTNAKYAGDCFLDATLSNSQDEIVFSTGCLAGDFPRAWIGIYKFRDYCKKGTDGKIRCLDIVQLSPISFLIGSSGRNFIWSKDDKTITYEADLGLSGLTETRTIDSATGDVLKKISSQNKSVGQQIYKNSKYGFELTFPDKDWFLPSEDDEDPHFYASEACAKNERSNCFALEIQNHDNDSEYLGGWQAMFDTLKANNQNPAKLTSLIPDATVIKSVAPGPAEGWGYEYDIYFEKSKRIFLIFTNTEILEGNIISTFRLFDWKTYRNEEYGFELKYPGFWKDPVWLESGNEKGINFGCPEFDFEGDKYCPLRLGIYEAKNKEEVISSLSNAVPFEKNGVLINGGGKPTIKEFTIDGREAITYYDAGICNEAYTDIFDDKMTVSFADRCSMYEGEIFYQILSTFKFIEKNKITGWNIYSNKEKNFSFEYPDSFYLLNSYDRDVLELVNLKDGCYIGPVKAVGLEGSVLKTYTIKTATGVIDVEYLENSEKIFFAAPNDFGQITKEKSNIPTIFMNSMNLLPTGSGLINGKEGVAISSSSTIKNISKNCMEDFAEILSTFKFIE